MQTVTLKLVTIVVEALLEEHLLRDLKGLGVRGWTITSARGEGSRGLRTSEWEGQNVKIETLVSADTATLILEHLARHYFELYALVAWVETVEVVRGEKYV